MEERHSLAFHDRSNQLTQEGVVPDPDQGHAEFTHLTVGGDQQALVRPLIGWPLGLKGQAWTSSDGRP